ncbi:AEC family transporter [Leptolyngbya sp. FACHB-36]|uniref:AEC family transporter n=1 Tax=Leptolyngbya sp. FACHB-36 TaxID=2692808 RepID=UPI001680571E|nr:AEC family transporter [Leptolyngbya sp. FACHB-36]MBD2022358.1 AEC family transporter [Leptolyngbya sp. FACHB-36]
MTETLFDAYLPLILWTSVGLVAIRFTPPALPRLLGRVLYWFGVPWEVLALARQTDIDQSLGLAPIVTLASLIVGLLLAWLILRWLTPPAVDPAALNRAQQGSFILAATIGNTGFVGLGIIPSLIDQRYLGWAVFYSVTQNVVGTYGIGVFLASFFGRSAQANHWWVQLRDVATVPSLWAFALGTLTRSLPLPAPVELGLHASLWFVIPSAFLLMGMRLSQLQGWKSLRQALIPTLLKVGVLPAGVGIAATAIGLTGDARLALVLMAGMPSAFAGLILAEEYNLDRDLIASSIALTTIALLFTIPLWLTVF